MFVRKDEVLSELDAWLAGQFAPDRIEAVIEEMTAAQDSTGHQQMITEAHQAIRERRQSAHKRTWQAIPMGLWFVSEGRYNS
ncbi:MAG TPA: hypothetical protein VLW44_04995 [Streptosporangiaceae bacterium]|nr:hypothetical protein [Streptosporangiaceae bacterium]